MESQPTQNLQGLDNSKLKTEESKFGSETAKLTSSMRDLKRIDKQSGDDGCDQVTLPQKNNHEV